MSTTDTLFDLAAGEYSVIVTDANDCQQTISITVDLLSAASSSFKANISIYPTILHHNRLHVASTQNYTGPVSIDIMDMQGKIISRIRQQGLKNGDVLEVGNLKASMYLLRIQHATFQLTKRMIKI